MSKSRFLKAVLSVLALLVLCIVLYNVLIEESSILSGISFDGYKDLNKGEEIYILRRKKALKGGALVMPENWKEKFSVQVTFPRFFAEGMRRLTLKAEDGDLVLTNLSTKPLKRTYEVKRYDIPRKPDLRPLLSP
ncbi:hypothetical protein KGY79_05130 [Candidatus Bipolaricaulota bacterium]|nr:hypothetical protein [Candidatus Bipolaricaulota bacterium]